MFLFIFFVLNIRYAVSLESPEPLKPYEPIICPEKVNFENQVCGDICDHHNIENGMTDEIRNTCVDFIKKVSNRTYHQLMEISTETLQWIDDCKRPEEAFKQSIILPDKTIQQLLMKFSTKLNSCKKGKTVSIAIFGGSVTTGRMCNLKVGEIDYDKTSNPAITNHLNLPSNITLPIIRGDEMCPWASQLYTLLKKTYPECSNIDIYNLAHSSTDHVWLLDNIIELFNRPNGARGGHRLGDIVDLILVDYGVNDGQGYRFSRALERLKLKPTESNALGRIEALTEYFIQFVLNKKDDPSANHPALIYVQSGAAANSLGLMFIIYIIYNLMFNHFSCHLACFNLFFCFFFECVQRETYNNKIYE